MSLNSNLEIAQAVYNLQKKFKNICNTVKCCIGISSTGNTDLFLNQRGQWTEAGGGSELIEITSSALYLLIVNSEVENATYNITDIEGFAGVYLEGKAPNIVSQSGYGVLNIPTYNISGVYKGQLLQADSVTIGDKWTYGGRVWESTTGTNSTPLNDWDLDPTDWDLMPYTDNGYTTKQFIVEYDINSGIVTLCKELPQNSKGSVSFTEYSNFTDAHGAEFMQQWGYPLNDNNSGIVINNKIGVNSEVRGNTAKIDNNSLDGGSIDFNLGLTGDNQVSLNIIESNGFIGSNVLNVGSLYSDNTIKNEASLFNMNSSNSEITGNYLDGTDVRIAYGIQNDASEIKNNHFEGTNIVLEASLQNNNSKIIGNTCIGSGIVMGGLSQLKLDEVNNNEIYGTNIGFSIFTQKGNSQINNFKIGTVGVPVSYVYVEGIEQINSTLSGTYTTDNKVCRNINMSNTSVINFTDIDITNCNFKDISLDLTGFTSDIDNVIIDGKSGSLNFSIDFAVTPLVAGSSFYFSLIPDNSYCTEAVLLVDGLSGLPGAELEIGIDTDDEDYILASTALGSVTNGKVSLLSDITTANRAIKVTASVANITTGTITVNANFLTI